MKTGSGVGAVLPANAMPDDLSVRGHIHRAQEPDPADDPWISAGALTTEGLSGAAGIMMAGV